MQMVIEIPESQYKTLNAKTQEDVVDVIDDKLLIDAIRKGTPLPKGHGDLKDVDKIISDGIGKGFCDWYDEMKYAPTIIEADKESEI